MAHVRSVSQKLEHLEVCGHVALIIRHKLLCVCSLYNNTRDLSANAVAAGQAYQNIVKFISAAHNNSVEAVEDAERALNEVGLESSDVWQGKEKERVQGSLLSLKPVLNWANVSS